MKWVPGNRLSTFRMFLPQQSGPSLYGQHTGAFICSPAQGHSLHVFPHGTAITCLTQAAHTGPQQWTWSTRHHSHASVLHSDSSLSAIRIFSQRHLTSHANTFCHLFIKDKSCSLRLTNVFWVRKAWHLCGRHKFSKILFNLDFRPSTTGSQEEGQILQPKPWPSVTVRSSVHCYLNIVSFRLKCSPKAALLWVPRVLESMWCEGRGSLSASDKCLIQVPFSTCPLRALLLSMLCEGSG